MDTSYEDNMYRQIENSLSNNINDRLFVPIEMIDRPTFRGKSNKQSVDTISYDEETVKKEPDFLEVYKANEDRGDVGNDAVEYREEEPRLSRAEYIIQAREACLRQMSLMDSSGRPYDDYGNDLDSIYSTHERKKRSKVERLFNDTEEEVPPEELASFRSLIIRTVCAAVIFTSIFIIDKVKVEWGVFSYETIQRYVTGNNQLKVLEELIVSWLK